MTFIVPAIALIGVVSIAFGNRRNHGVLSKARIDKTTQRNPRQRRTQCESNFRRHGHDETGFVSVVQAFYYNVVMFERQGNASVTRRRL